MTSQPQDFGGREEWVVKADGTQEGVAGPRSVGSGGEGV